VLGEAHPLEDELQQLARVHEETLRDVNAFPLERWNEERMHEGLKIRRKVSVALFGINEHQIHHRAQATTYLRILTGERASAYDL
ncbi:MAG: hypothetical protein ACRD10_08685, partial [Terriglobia bacterium]